MRQCWRKRLLALSDGSPADIRVGMHVTSVGRDLEDELARKALDGEHTLRNPSRLESAAPSLTGTEGRN